MQKSKTPKTELTKIMQKYHLTRADIAEYLSVSKHTVNAWLAAPDSQWHRNCPVQMIKLLQSTLTSKNEKDTNFIEISAAISESITKFWRAAEQLTQTNDGTIAISIEISQEIQFAFSLAEKAFTLAETELKKEMSGEFITTGDDKNVNVMRAKKIWRNIFSKKSITTKEFQSLLNSLEVLIGTTSTLRQEILNITHIKKFPESIIHSRSISIPEKVKR